MNKTIGEKILELRKARSLTQEKLGEQLGISSQAVSKWENGDSMPDILVLPQLCEILGISIDSLLEVPHTLKKEGIMKAFREYSNDKDVGTPKALFEAFDCVSGINEPYIGLGTKLGPTAIEIFDAVGAGFVIAGKEYMDLVLNYDVDAITSYFSIFADKKIMSVMKELSISVNYTKEELLEKTQLSLDELNSILLQLMEKKICAFENNDKGEVGYILHGSPAYMLPLTGYYITTPRTNITQTSVSINRT
jgi:Predicted transcriptional regulators